MPIENAGPTASRPSGRPTTAVTLILASIGAFATSPDVVVVAVAAEALYRVLSAVHIIVADTRSVDIAVLRDRCSAVVIAKDARGMFRPPDSKHLECSF
jgi:hypothetical protein